MTTSQNIFNNMQELWNTLEENHNSFSQSGNKAAGTRARKAAGEFKKILMSESWIMKRYSSYLPISSLKPIKIS